MSNATDWFSRLEQQLEQQLEAFLQANPAQEQLLLQQEQRERQQRLRRRRLELQASAERARSDLLRLAGEIRQWQERVQRARSAGADALAERAEAHLADLMGRGRDHWQALGQLGEDYRRVEEDLRAMAENPGAAQPSAQAEVNGGPAGGSDDLEQAWTRFEAEQDLEQLRRSQQAGRREN
jgi:hercynine metabolism protein